MESKSKKQFCIARKYKARHKFYLQSNKKRVLFLFVLAQELWSRTNFGLYGSQKFGHSFSFHDDQKENYVIVLRDIQQAITIYTEVKKTCN